MMKTRHWIALALLGLFGACTYRFVDGLRTDVYRGQVVDAEEGRRYPRLWSLWSGIGRASE